VTSWIVCLLCAILTRGLHRFDVIKQYALVAFRVHLFINLSQLAFGIDHERGAVPVHRAFVFALAGTCG